MKNVLAKLNASGNLNILLCERGASFGYNTLVSDMTSAPSVAVIGAREVGRQPSARGRVGKKTHQRGAVGGVLDAADRHPQSWKHLRGVGEEAVQPLIIPA